MTRRVGSALAIAAMLAGCSALVDTEGLSGTTSPTDAAAETAITGDASRDASPDGGGGGYSFTDDFARDDGSAIGNGWTEKTDPAFSLTNGTAFSASSPQDYTSNLVYRPVSEDQRDVELSIELVASGSKWPTPQIFARAQREGISGAGSYTGYLLFLANEQTLAIGRQSGDKFVEVLAEKRPNPLLANGNRYRLTLRASGTSPVSLEGIVELQQAGMWTTIANVTFTDTAGTRTTQSGAFGFSVSAVGGLTYDNFAARALGP